MIHRLPIHSADISLKISSVYKDLDKLIKKFVHKSRPPSISSLFIHKDEGERTHSARYQEVKTSEDDVVSGLTIDQRNRIGWSKQTVKEWQ